MPLLPCCSLWRLSGERWSSHITAGGELGVFNVVFEVAALLCEQFRIEGGKVVSSIHWVAPSQLPAQLSNPLEAEYHKLVLQGSPFVSENSSRQPPPGKALYCERSPEP